MPQPKKEKTMSVTKLMLTGIARPELVFCSAATAAEYLGVHEKHVFRLVTAGHLERIHIVDNKGREVGVGIIQESVEAYRAREPLKPGPKRSQLDFLGDET